MPFGNMHICLLGILYHFIWELDYNLWPRCGRRSPETSLHHIFNVVQVINTVGRPGADPGFLKGGGARLGLQAKKGGQTARGVQFWAQC